MLTGLWIRTALMCTSSGPPGAGHRPTLFSQGIIDDFAHTELPLLKGNIDTEDEYEMHTGVARTHI